MSEIFYRLKFPRVIGQLMAGLIFALPFFKRFITSDAASDISFLSNLGIIFLLLLAGMEINLKQFKKAEKNSFVIAISCALLPFLLGVILMKALDYSNIVAFVAGACFALTAEATKLKVLIDMHVLRSRVGTIMLEAGIIDDMFEVLYLGIILILAHGSIVELGLFPFKLILFIIIAFVSYVYLPKLVRLIHKEHNQEATFSMVLVVGLIIAVISESLGLGPVIGAFLAGVLIQLSDHFKKEEHDIIEELKIFTFAFIIPFFFLNIGLHFDYASIFQNIGLVILVILVATVGKLLGAVIVTPLTDLTLKQTHLIGLAMNSRGAVELIIAEIARKNELIPIEVYSAIVAMAVVTTIIFPIVLRNTISKEKNIMK